MIVPRYTKRLLAVGLLALTVILAASLLREESQPIAKAPPERSTSERPALPALTTSSNPASASNQANATATAQAPSTQPAKTATTPAGNSQELPPMDARQIPQTVVGYAQTPAQSGELATAVVLRGGQDFLLHKYGSFDMLNV